MQNLISLTLATAEAMKKARFPITGLLGTLGEMFTLQKTGGQLSKNNSRGHDIIAANGERVEVKTYDYDSRLGGNIKVRVGTFDRLFVWCYMDGQMVQVLNLTSEEVSDSYKIQKDGKFGIRAASLLDHRQKSKPKERSMVTELEPTVGKEKLAKPQPRSGVQASEKRNLSALLWAKMNEVLPNSAREMFPYFPNESKNSISAAFRFWRRSTVKEFRNENALESKYSATIACKRHGWLAASKGLDLAEATDQMIVSGAAHLTARSACRQGFDLYNGGHPIPV